MTKTSLSRALLLAGLLAAAGTASAFMDDESAELSASSTQTWLFPDGSSHTVALGEDSGAPDTTALGAGPAALMSGLGSETRFYPDGTSPDGTAQLSTPPESLSRTTVVTVEMGAGPANFGSSLGPLRQEPSYSID